MLIKLNPLRTLVNSFLILVVLSSFFSCFSWKDAEPLVSVRTDVRVHVTVNDFSTNNPIPNQLVVWSIHLYTGQSDTESHIKTGEVTTNANGEADIPVYECMLNAGLIVRIIAFTLDQSNDMITPLTVYFDEALDASNDENYAEIFIDYPILK